MEKETSTGLTRKLVCTCYLKILFFLLTVLGKQGGEFDGKRINKLYRVRGVLFAAFKLMLTEFRRIRDFSRHSVGGFTCFIK